MANNHIFDGKNSPFLFSVVQYGSGHVKPSIFIPSQQRPFQDFHSSTPQQLSSGIAPAFSALAAMAVSEDRLEAALLVSLAPGASTATGAGTWARGTSLERMARSSGSPEMGHWTNPNIGIMVDLSITHWDETDFKDFFWRPTNINKWDLTVKNHRIMGLIRSANGDLNIGMLPTAEMLWGSPCYLWWWCGTTRTTRGLIMYDLQT